MKQTISDLTRLKKENVNLKFEIDLLKKGYFQLKDTSRKLAQSKKELSVSDENFRAIYENSLDAIMTLEPPSWKFTSGNPATLKMFMAKDVEHFSNYMPWLKLSPLRQPDGELSKTKAKRMIEIAMRKRSNYFEWTHRRLNGEIFPATVLLTKVVLPDKTFCLATVKDITESKIAENKLKASEENFRGIFERAGDGILLAELKTKKFVLANTRMTEISGYSKEELAKKSMSDIHPKNRLMYIMKQFDKQAKGKLLTAKDIPVLRKDKTIVYCDITSKPFIYNNQNVMLGLFRDVTYRKDIEQKLKESEYFFRESQNAASIGSYKFDLLANTWTSSEVLNRIFGIDTTFYKSFESWLSLIHHDDRKMMESYFKKEVLEKHRKFNIEYRIIRHSDGETRWVTGLGSVNFDGSSRPASMFGTVQDITEKKYIIDKNEWLASFPELEINPIVELEINGRVIYLNPIAQKLFPDMKKVGINHPVLRPVKKYFAKLDNILDPAFFREVEFDNKWYLQKFSSPRESVLRIYFTDISIQKSIEKSISYLKERDESILLSIGDAVFAVNLGGKITIFNRVAELLTNIQSNFAIGKHYSQIVNFVRESDGLPCNDFIREAMTTGKITEMSNHAMLLRKDEVKIAVADSAAPIVDEMGYVSGCVVAFHEVTKERQIDKAKTEFVSLASHHLRTPLSTINWYSEILLSEDLGHLNPKQKQYSQEVYRASQRMVALVNALLNVSRLELGNFAVEPEKVDVAKIAKMVIKDLTPLIEAKRINIQEHFDRSLPKMMVDPKLMAIIFQNLFSNSIKYSKTNGKVEITIRKKDDELLISVEDHGYGIPSSQKKEIFGKMFRADNAKKIDPDGTGLGLYIVREIINYTGGKAWFASSEGKGSTFYASLPISGMRRNESKKLLI